MSGMNLEKLIHQARELAAAGAGRIRDNPSAALDAVVKWGRFRQDESTPTRTVAAIIDTVADKAKAGRRTRKRTMKALKQAARELRHQSPAHKRNKTTWLIAGLLLTATVGTIITVHAKRYPEGPGRIESTPAVQAPAETTIEPADNLDPAAQENGGPPAPDTSTNESDDDLPQPEAP